jgi:hypothetical protein
MSQGKDFSVLKWLIFPPLVCALSAGIAYFNVDVFGLNGSVLYLIALGAVNVVSFVMVKFSGSSKRPVRIASFIFESLMIAALVVNISYSLSAQRDLSLVKQDGAERKSEIAEIGKLRSRKAQATLAEKLGEKTDVRHAFGQYESILFWIMVAELTLSFAGLMSVYGLAAIKPGLRKIPRGAFRGTRPTMQESFPGAFGAAIQAERGAQIGFAPLKPPEASLKQSEASLKRVEETSGMENRPSGAMAGDLRVIGQDSGVRVYDRNEYLGHIAWSRYLAGVGDSQKPTEAEIVSLLNSR